MSETETAAPGAESHEFGAEVGRLLDLVVHSLYSDREIFLRELIANAADAIDRRRFEALTRPALVAAGEPSVRISADAAARTLTVADDGIGMTRQEMADNLGTIARSGTRAFGQTLADAPPDQRPSLIGQFGVGFYAAFMVAERVEVTSRKAGEEAAWLWASDGRGRFTLAPAARDAAGTTIVLHMKPDAEEFLEPTRLEGVVRKWAEHITVPITVARDGKDEAANEGTALWRRPKGELNDEDYEGFFRHLGHFFGKPWATLHWRAEGAIEFSALLFIPDSKPFGPVEEERTSRVRLHVRRMFITKDAELLPPWLRFVDGVVDTEDLPLNVSREMLQSTPVLARIRKAVTNRVLGELKSAAADGERYGKFWEVWGPVLKEGIWEDSDHRQELAGLLRARSTAVEGWTTLTDYLARMKEGQDAIYVLVGEDAAALGRSAQLEGFRARGLEVLLLSDPIDAFWPERLASFEGKTIRSVTQGQADLAKFALEFEPQGEGADVAALVIELKAALGEAVADVRATDRLVHSAVVLTAGGFGPDLAMQRLLRRAGRGNVGAPLPVLEINPRHALIAALAQTAAAGGSVVDAAGILLDLARIQDGEPPRDAAAFARAVEQALSANRGGSQT